MPSQSSGGCPVGEEQTFAEASLIAGRFDGDQVLVPLLTRKVLVLADQLKVATTLARITDVPLIVISPFPDPEQTSNVHRHEATDYENVSLLDWVFGQTDESLPQIESDFLYAWDVVQGISQAVR